MARVNDQLDSDDELPKLSSLFKIRTEATPRTQIETSRQEHGSIPSQRKKTQKLAADNPLTVKHATVPTTLTEGHSDKPQSRKQRPLGHLKQAHIDFPLLPTSDASVNDTKIKGSLSIEAFDGASTRASPRELVNSIADHRRHHEDCSYTDLSGFIVPDSATEGELSASSLPRKKKKEKKKRQKQKNRSVKISAADPHEPGFQESRQPPLNAQQLFGKTNSIYPGEKIGREMGRESLPSNETFRSELAGAHPNLDGYLTISPPTLKSSYEFEDNHHSLTPPSTPSISKLESPSKRHRIPPSPHRPSIDAFWSQDVINDWNEQYSPKKIVESPRKIQLYSVDKDDQESPSENPRKSPLKSPTKANKKIVEQRKLFNDRKFELAITFLAEVDRTITGGQVASMADSTGGIRVIWSKKLSSTAGRANWRREAIRSKNADGSIRDTTYRHHASIELAEKVIDDENRLINVVAHEYCHLANFMISGIKDNPHGKDFKEWARKCTKAFSYRGIEVTTKHTYNIAYKYIWTCMSPTCGLEYKRHSKSIDPSKHSCGNCKGKLVQVQPAPRKGVGEGKRSDYQDFVKWENQRVRRENPGAGFGEIMSILGREFRERNRNEAERTNGVEEHSAFEKAGSNEPECPDSLVRKLGFLDLGG